MDEQLKKRITKVKSSISKLYAIAASDGVITENIQEKIIEVRDEFHKLNLDLLDLELITDTVVEIEDSYVEKMKYLTQCYKMEQPTQTKGLEHLLQPKIFSGKILEFRNWATSTLKMIENTNASGEDKLIALKNSVSGKALFLIKHLTSFAIAKTRLEEYYADPEVVTNECFAELKTLKLDYSHYPSWLEQVSHLENISQAFGSSGPQVSHVKAFKRVIARKLPERMVQDFIRKDGINSSLEDLVKFIRDQTKILKHEMELGVNKSLMLKPKTNSAGNRCVLCEQQHKSFFCDTGSAKSRLDMALKLKVCKICFLKDHKTADCRSAFKCKKCGKNHATILCVGKKPINMLEDENEVADEEILNC